MNLCRSVYSWNISNNFIQTARCIHEEGHRGECHDVHGHAWVRVAEWIRRAREAA